MWSACPTGRSHRHRKLHAFESDDIASGDSYTVFDTPWGVKVGVLICWDNNLVENARATALLGADIVMAPHQTGGCNSRSPHAMGLIDPALWENRHNDPEAHRSRVPRSQGPRMADALAARPGPMTTAISCVFSNGVGEDDGEVRTGNAMIIDCYGRIVAETWKAQDDLVVADLDLDLLPLATGRRWIRGRRPDLYGLLTQAQGMNFHPARRASRRIRW